MSEQKYATKVTRVRAIKTGYHGTIRKGKDEDGNGGDVFTIEKGEPIGSWMEVVEELEEPAPASKELTVADIKAALDEKEIEYPASAKKKELLALLSDSEEDEEDDDDLT